MKIDPLEFSFIEPRKESQVLHHVSNTLRAAVTVINHCAQIRDHTLVVGFPLEDGYLFSNLRRQGNTVSSREIGLQATYALFQKRKVAINKPSRIVQLMGDSCDQLAERSHLCVVRNLCLKALEFRFLTGKFRIPIL